MAKLKIMAAECCLITVLSDHLATLGTKRLDHIRVVLPTLRLATLLRAALAQRLGGAMIPPKISNFDQFIESLLQTKAQVAVDDTTADLMIAILFERLKTRHLAQGHERELRHFFNEILEHGLDERAFRQLEAELAQDCYKSEGQLGSLSQRFHEMQVVFNELRQHLATDGLVLRGEKSARDAERVMAMLAGGELKSVLGTKLIFAGFTSLISAWKGLWRRLGQEDAVVFWLSEAPPIPANPLKELIELLPSDIEKEHIKSARAAAPMSYTLTIAEDLATEVRDALLRAKELLDSGFVPSQLAILVSDEALYAPVLRSLVQGFALKANLAIATPLSQTRIGEWITALSRLILSPRDGAALASWLLNELSLKLLDLKLGLGVNTLQSLCFKALQEHGHGGFSEFVVNAASDSKLKALVEVLNAEIGPYLKRSERLDYWLKHLGKALDSLVPSSSHDAMIRSQAEAIARLNWGLAELLRLMPAAQSGARFIKLVERRLEVIDIRDVGEPLSGIQVLSLPESRYMPFQCALILGMNEGCFPKALPQDALIDDYLKRKMGLPGWQRLEAMEDLSFHFLKLRLPQLELFRHERSLKHPQTPSRYIVNLEAANQLRVQKSKQSWQKVLAQHWQADVIGSLAVASAETDLEGRCLTDLDSLLWRQSATSVQRLIRCPYQYLLSNLGLSAPELPQPFEDFKRQGEWLHQVVEHFLRARDAQGLPTPWPDLKVSSEAFKELALERLNLLTKAFAPKGQERDPLRLHLKHFAWPRLVAHWAHVYHGQAASALLKGYREYDLGGTVLSIGSKERELSGSIDSIDVVETLWIVTDFKRSGLPESVELKNGVASQLPFYCEAILVHKPQAQAVVAGYWSLLKGEWTSVAVSEAGLAQAISLGLATPKTPRLKDLIQSYQGLFGWREQDVRESERFYADPSNCLGCFYPDLCRKDDPDRRERIHQQDRLRQRLGGTTAEAEDDAL